MAVKLRKQEEVAARTIDLRKKVSLAKERAGLLAQAAQVEFVLDISGSFAGRYRDNTIQDIVERLAPIALEFDADGAMPVTLFGVDAHEAPPITKPTFANTSTAKLSSTILLRAELSMPSRSGILSNGIAVRQFKR